jgi:hypothetical protein
VFPYENRRGPISHIRLTLGVEPVSRT